MSMQEKLKSKIHEFLVLLISISGYVPQNATFYRTVFMALSISFYLLLNFRYPFNFIYALIYFLSAEIFYFGFLWFVLREKGLKGRLIKRWDEKKAYLIYEGILGFLFFHNAASIGFLSSATRLRPFDITDNYFLLIAAVTMFVSGLGIKLLCTKILSVDIYYWKDMFVGRKIIDFKREGPYKYFSNPMYGVGQLQAYAVAVWYCSMTGLLAAMINQIMIFIFYFHIERKFIRKIYTNTFEDI